MPKVDFDSFIVAKKEQLTKLAETRQVKTYLELQTYIADLETLKETILAEGDNVPQVKEKKSRTPRHQAKMPNVDGMPILKITSTPAANFDPTLEEPAE